MRSKKIVSVVVSGALALSLTAPYSTYANGEIDKKISEIEEKINQSERKQEEIDQKLQDNKAKQEEERRTLSQLEADLEQTKSDIETLNRQIADTERELDQTEEELKEAEKRVAERDKLLRERVRLLYENGKVSYLEVLFQATSFQDFLSRFEAVRSVSERDKELLEENRRDREIIASHKKKMEEQLATLDDLKEKANEKRRLLAQQEKEHQTKLAALQREAGHLETISEEEEKAVNDLIGQLAQAEAEKEEWQRQEEQRKQQEEKKQRQQKEGQKKREGKSGSSQSAPPRARVSSTSSSAPQSSSSGFAWPVPGYGVTSYFGNRFHPVYKEWRLHAGIDIGAPAGEPIVAAADGTVTAVRPSSGYGNIVVIYHGNGISTKYAHMPYSSITVRPNQKVKKGQKIAEVGSEGTATGPHLHFEVLKWNTPVNPMQYY